MNDNAGHSLSRIDGDESRMLSDSQLIAEIKRQMSTCAFALARLASLVAAARERCIDVSFINRHVLEVLDRIEKGKVVPELAEQFMHCVAFRKLKNLSVDQQKRLVKSKSVSIAKIKNGELIEESIPIEKLSEKQTDLAFDSNRVRTRSEMAEILNGRRKTPISSDSPIEIEKRKTDELRGYLGGSDRDALEPMVDFHCRRLLALLNGDDKKLDQETLLVIERLNRLLSKVIKGKMIFR